MVVRNNDARHMGLTLTLLVLIALALVGCGSPTIATINGDTISGDAFAERFKYDTYLWTLGLGEQALQDRRAAGQIVLETMIDEQITYQKAEEAGITASDVAILEHRAEVLGEVGYEDAMNLIAEETGIDIQRVKDLFQEQMRGFVLTIELEGHYNTPFEQLIEEWRDEAEIDVSDAWETFIPRD
jgi:parvulin-like peptidyl-prolyl isomerase